jgi:hypothetical protein
MTGCVPGRMPAPRMTQAAAITTWAYAGGFGVPTVPVAIYLVIHGRLPTFLGLFPMYGGPWSSRLKRGPFIALLGAFLVLTRTAAGSAQSSCPTGRYQWMTAVSHAHAATAARPC